MVTVIAGLESVEAGQIPRQPAASAGGDRPDLELGRKAG
jgi:hypothetical protein